MSESRITVGELVAAFLERCGATTGFGVISIHNMPILDAFLRRGRMRFVPTRSEPGAVNMADAFARVSGGLGVAVTSTGTAAGNAAGALVEAQTAGTPLLHLTGQIDLAYLDRDLGFIHEARDQLGMLRSVSKAAYRIWNAETALGVLREAVHVAMTPPMGPVSVEIPIDVQKAMVAVPRDLSPVEVATAMPTRSAIDALAERLGGARRPLVWLGGGARHARKPVERLVALGFGVVTSVQGRGVIAEDHPMTLGAFNLQPPVEAFYATCDAILVAGSRLRSNETLGYKLRLPPLLRIDVDPRADGRAYANELFACGDAAVALDLLADALEGRLRADPEFAGDLAAARRAADKLVRDGLGPYARMIDMVQRAAGRDGVWVRDITLSNSTWGNRSLLLAGPRDGVHALGGGIGQGLPMAIGAALAAPGRKVLALVGDGGLQVNIGEIATAVQEKVELTVLVMNDRGYGVIRNIQDAHYGGRRGYADLVTPEFDAIARSVGAMHRRVETLDDLPAALAASRGVSLVEIDMVAIGPFAKAFAGPPVRTSEKVNA